MESLRKEQLVCHASGDFGKVFAFGFYLFHIVQNEKGLKN